MKQIENRCNRPRRMGALPSIAVTALLMAASLMLRNQAGPQAKAALAPSDLSMQVEPEALVTGPAPNATPLTRMGARAISGVAELPPTAADSASTSLPKHAVRANEATADTADFEDLTVAQQQSLWAAFAKARREILPISELNTDLPLNAGARYYASNTKQKLNARFLDDALRVHSGVKGSGGQALFRLASSSPVREIRTTGSRIEYVRDELIEWYENTPAGIEQGFTLFAAPTTSAGDGDIRLDIALEGLQARDGASDNDALELTDADGAVVLTYAKLKAWDANGRELDSRMSPSAAGIALHVDSADAQYPITIDPLIATQLAKLGPEVTGDGAANDIFGFSVCISGDSAIVGAERDDDNGQDSGSAYVFVRSGATWIQQQKLTAGDGAANDKFGASVSISGDSAIVGADFDDDSGQDSGSAYVFVRSGTIWSQQQKLTASDGANLDYFGAAVSISGDSAIVGAYRNEGNGSRSGSAYVFVRSGATWSQQQKLTASDGAADDRFGVSTSISGDSAIVGAYLDGDSGTFSGSAYVFVRSGTNWIQQQKLTASDGAAIDYFGHSVSISGDSAIIGADSDDHNGINTGSAYVFVRSSATWIQQQKLTASNGSRSGDHFGVSTSISGDRAVVGAHRDDDSGESSGSAYVFVRSGTNWIQLQKLTADDSTEYDYFGRSVSISGDSVIVGAYGDDGFAGNGAPEENHGSAYVFVPQRQGLLVYTASTQLPTNSTSALPYAESFESYAPGTIIVDTNGFGSGGWFGEPATSNMAVVKATNYSWATEYPLPDATHTTVLAVAGMIGNRFSYTNWITSAKVDFTCMLEHFTFAPSLDPDSQFACYVDTDGHLVVRHAFYTNDFQDVVPVWTVLENTSVAIDEWVRLTITFDYLYASNSLGEHYGFGHWFRIQLNGDSAISNALAYRTPTPSDEMADRGGNWFLCSDNTPLTTGPEPKFFSNLGFAGKGHLDDIVVTIDAPYFELPPFVQNNLGATDITDTSAMLNGMLVYTGGAPTQVYIYWGTDNGGRKGVSWTNVIPLGQRNEGPFSHSIGALPTNTVLFYRCLASNVLSAAWAPATAIFRTGDSDFDGMPDVWEMLHFGDLLRDGTGNFDGDGWTDLDEYLNGTDPKISDGTYASGTLRTNTTWSIAGSPYIVTNTLTILKGLTLTVEPAVSVWIKSQQKIVVEGELRAVGTHENSIVFTRDVGDTWGGEISFQGENVTNLCATGVFEHCSFSHLDSWPGTNPNSPLNATFADLTVRDCSFDMIEKADGIANPEAITAINSLVTIVGNTFSQVGGGIGLQSCAGIVASNHIVDVLYASDGIDVSGIWPGPGDPSVFLIGNVLLNASYSGADGIDLDNTGTNVFIIGNIIRGYPDKGMSLGNSSPLIRNCLVVGEGGRYGLSIRSPSAPRIWNTTVVGCGDGLSGSLGSAVNLIVWGCTRGINASGMRVGFSDVQSGGSYINDPGNISTNPLFVDESAGAFRLSSSSPCIDLGTNEIWMTVTTDLDGRPRIIHDTVDMGAYEAILPAWDSNTNGLPDWWEWQYSHSLTGIVPSADTDSDGMNDGDEYSAGTNPTNAASVLAITELSREGNSVRIGWQGGTSVWQYLQRRHNLLATGAEWETILTNPPPTPVVTNITDEGATNPTIFYRIRAVRP